MMIASFNLKRLLWSILLPVFVGSFAGYLVRDSFSVYEELVLPAFAPPPLVFKIVWPILYVLMGVAAYIILSSRAYSKGRAMNLYYTQLALNFTWVIFFFGFDLMKFSVIIIIALWAFILLTILSFLVIDRKAAYILVPYLLWVSFAAYLNVGIAILN